MIIERIGISAPDGRKQQMGSALVSLTGPTHVQAGCLGCRLFQNWQEPYEFLIEAEWAAEGDLIRHLQSDTYKQLLLLMELSPRPPVVQFYTVQDVRALDLVQEARNSLN